MKMRHLLPAAGLAAAAAVVAAGAAPASPHSGKPVLRSVIALDAQAETVTLPLFRARTASGGTTWYIVTESSNAADAKKRGVTWAPRLANALGTKAVQKATQRKGELVLPGTVDFSPKAVVEPGKEGFPPAKAEPGAVGDARYSPLVATGRTVINASQVKNETGQSDSIVSVDTAKRRVTFKLLRGFFDGQSVLYLRTDASVGLLAAVEASTYAPNLNAAPGLASNGARSARSAIIPIVNGARGKTDPQRQGLQSALLGEGDPLNITQSFPGSKNYSPLWDVTPAVWSDGAISAGQRTIVKSAGAITKLVENGRIVSGGTSRANASLGGLKAAGFISNCAIVGLG